MSDSEVWTCDKCGGPISFALKGGDLRYAPADDPENRRGRHARCQPTFSELQANTNKAFADLRSTLDRLHRDARRR